MDLTTTARVKDMKQAGGGSRSDKADTFIGSLIDLYSKAAEVLLRRTVTTATYTETLDVEPGQQIFRLKAFPVSAVSSVINDVTWDFDGSAVSSDYYRTKDSGARGVLMFRSYPLSFGDEALQVIYRGGMATTVTAFVAAYPVIAQAVEMQIVYHLQRKEKLGGTTYSQGGSSVLYEKPIGWLDYAKELLSTERSFRLG